MVTAKTHDSPREGDSGEPERTDEDPPSIVSSWIDLIDDLGPTVFLDGIDAPGLDERLASRGARRTGALAEASTVVLAATSVIDPSALPDDVTVAVLASNPMKRRFRTTIDLREWVVPAAPLHRIRSRLGGAVVVFGLLPSAEQPHCALDASAPAACRYALDALSLHVSEAHRRSLVRLIRLAVRRRLTFLFPAWLVVRHGRGRASGPRVSAQFSYGHNAGLTRFVGEPPQWVEREASRHRVDAERRALLELDGGGGLTPRIVSTPRPAVVATSLSRGRPLDLQVLGDQQIEVWTERAASVLARLQDLTRRDDGTVLVHGDYWLGNVMVDGERVVGVIDWEEAHRGDPSLDRSFLVASFLRFAGREDDEVLARRLRLAAARGFGAG